MPHYFFDVQEGDCLVPDQDGLEFQDIEAAKAEAVRALAGMVKDALPDGTRREIAVVVRDGAKARLATARISFGLHTEA